MLSCLPVPDLISAALLASLKILSPRLSQKSSKNSILTKQQTSFLEEKKNKKKYNKYKLINNLINSTDGLIIIGTTSASVTLSITGVDIIAVPITAGFGCATGILVKICSSYLKKKE